MSASQLCVQAAGERTTISDGRRRSTAQFCDFGAEPDDRLRTCLDECLQFQDSGAEGSFGGGF
jgi:hypothetical protein